MGVHAFNPAMSNKENGIQGYDEMMAKVLADHYYKSLSDNFIKTFPETIVYKKEGLLDLLNSMYKYGITVGRAIEKAEVNRNKTK